jgi:transposase
MAYELIHHENQQKPTPAFSSSIDDAINQENQVRLIDLFCELTLPDFGFDFQFGRKRKTCLSSSDLLKLFIDGYLNRMCSSRTLEKECGRNIELMCGKLLPDHTIANFRKTIKAISRFSYHGKIASL